MSSSNSPCAACKCLRRKCTQECVFAPYFPPDQPQKFVNVHKVFGASNVAKLLNDLNASQREDAVFSLAYEADHRLRDPVYGCVGTISYLQQRLKLIQTDLYSAKKELASYIGPSSSSSPLYPFIQPNLMHHHHPNFNNNNPYGIQQPPMRPSGIISDYPVTGGGGGGDGQVIIRDTQQHQQQQQMFNAQQQMAAASSYDQNQQPQAQPADLMRFNNGFDTAPDYNNQMPHVNVAGMSSSSPGLFGSYENFTFHHPMLLQQQQQPSPEPCHPHSQQPHQLQFQSQIMLQPQATTLEQHSERAKSSEEGSELSACVQQIFN